MHFQYIYWITEFWMQIGFLKKKKKKFISFLKYKFKSSFSS